MSYAHNLLPHLALKASTEMAPAWLNAVTEDVDAEDEDAKLVDANLDVPMPKSSSPLASTESDTTSTTTTETVGGVGGAPTGSDGAPSASEVLASRHPKPTTMKSWADPPPAFDATGELMSGRIAAPPSARRRVSSDSGSKATDDAVTLPAPLSPDSLYGARFHLLHHGFCH